MEKHIGIKYFYYFIRNSNSQLNSYFRPSNLTNYKRNREKVRTEKRRKSYSDIKNERILEYNVSNFGMTLGLDANEIGIIDKCYLRISAIIKNLRIKIISFHEVISQLFLLLIYLIMIRFFLRIIISMNQWEFKKPWN